MDVFEALLTRRSCRRFIDQPVEREKIMRILECAHSAPSPANKQPWEFVVTENPKYNQELKLAVDAIKDKLADRSGWKWIPSYSTEFLLQAPVLVVIAGDPERNGAEQFLDEPGIGFEHACCAAIENMLLAARGLGLATLWFSLFEKRDVRRIFGIDDKLDPVAIVCVGYTDIAASAPARKELASKVKFLE